PKAARSFFQRALIGNTSSCAVMVPLPFHSPTRLFRWVRGEIMACYLLFFDNEFSDNEFSDVPGGSQGRGPASPLLYSGHLARAIYACCCMAAIFRPTTSIVC